MPHRIVFSPEARDHLRRLTARERRIVVDAIESQLRHQAAEETRNRVRMRPNRLAVWELRIDQFRAYYDVDESPELLVTVLAVGIKQGNRVRIGGEVVEL